MFIQKLERMSIKSGHKMAMVAQKEYKQLPENRMATKDEYEHYLSVHDPKIFTSSDGAGEKLSDFA